VANECLGRILYTALTERPRNHTPRLDTVSRDAISFLGRLIDHLEWANTRVVEGLRSSPGSDPRALEYFAHIVGCEHRWLTRIGGREPAHAIWPTLSVEQCAELARVNVAELRSALHDDLTREIAYRNSAGIAFVTPLEDILTHVVLHGMYHRGQVSLLVRQGGGEPVPSDFISYVRGAPAATQADAARVAAQGGR
jgi:uncharacterized damage-inducible protein DinB